MKSERLAYAFGKINDDLIYGAVNDTKKKYGWRRWIAAAACVCLVVGAAVALWPSGGKETVQEQLLAAIKTGGTMDTAAVETTIPVDSRKMCIRDAPLLLYTSSLEVYYHSFSVKSIHILHL